MAEKKRVIAEKNRRAAVHKARLKQAEVRLLGATMNQNHTKNPDITGKIRYLGSWGGGRSWKRIISFSKKQSG